MQPLNIMIAEDEALIAMLLADLLEAMGHHVCASVASEAEAVAAAAEFSPDLIIADGKLREGGGVSAMREILRSGHVPHIFVTGDPYQLGATPGSIVVRKPFTTETLLRAIDRALRPATNL